MKRIFTLFCTLFLVSALAACDSNDDGDDGGNGNGGASSSITASIDGATYTADNTSATFDSGVLQVTGTRGTMEQLTILVPNASQGTATVAQSSPVSIMYREGTTTYQANGVTVLAGASGSITVQVLSDAGAEGTFSGTLVDAIGSGSVTLTGGTFEVTF